MRNNKAQTFILYAALIAMVALAMVAMSKYLRRSLQGKYRDAADVFGGGTQYEPGATSIIHN
jgi:Flp pilus assembly pilin Flp